MSLGVVCVRYKSWHPQLPLTSHSNFFPLPSSIRFSYQESLTSLLFLSFFLSTMVLTTACPDQGFLMTWLPTSVLLYPPPVPPMLITFLSSEPLEHPISHPLLLSVWCWCWCDAMYPELSQTLEIQKKNKAELLPSKRSLCFGGWNPPPTPAIHPYSHHIPAMASRIHTLSYLLASVCHSSAWKFPHHSTPNSFVTLGIKFFWIP